MKCFYGVRVNPPESYIENGITNGPREPDYEGVEFADGTVVMRWLTLQHSTSIFPNWDMFIKIHGHPEYGTELMISWDSKDA